MQLKLSRLGKGIAVGAVAAVFAFLMLIYLLHALSWLFIDLFNWSTGENFWAGFGVTSGILLLLGIICALLAVRFIKKGSPPTPDLAIEEAKETRKTLEEARH